MSKGIADGVKGFIDSPRTNLLYYLPGVGGIKLYRTMEKAKAEPNDGWFKRNKNILQVIGFEAAKIGTLGLGAYGLNAFRGPEAVVGFGSFVVSSSCEKAYDPRYAIMK
jgi:hypothetical protein